MGRYIVAAYLINHLLICYEHLYNGNSEQLLGRPLLPKPSTCPQSNDKRSPYRGGTRQYMYVEFALHSFVMLQDSYLEE